MTQNPSGAARPAAADRASRRSNAVSSLVLVAMLGAMPGYAQVSFGTATNSPTGTNPQAIASADFNRDGKPDLATANAFTNDVSILLGDGAGGFGAAVSFSVAAGPFSIVAADLNGDGWPSRIPEQGATTRRSSSATARVASQRPAILRLLGPI